MMHAFVWGMPFIGSQVTFMVTFQSFGKSVQAMVITLGRQFLFYLPLLFLLNYLFGFNGFIWAQPSADILTTGIALFLSRPLFRLMRDTDKTSATDLRKENSEKPMPVDYKAGNR
jgi:Na+-driven multidrug efflux pump